jgi:hypothetical protein
MRGCSKGGSNNIISDAPLAYTGKTIITSPNPYLAYTGKGGSTCGLSNPSSLPQNINGGNPTIPNTGPVLLQGSSIYNSASQQRGGAGCGCGLSMTGGMCGPACLMPLGFMVAGSRHIKGCLCSKCKKLRLTKYRMKSNAASKKRGTMKKYISFKGGNPGIPYPAGLVGNSWNSSPSTWPGVNGIPGDSNHLSLNTYKPNDVSRQIVDVGANPPFLNGGSKNRRKKLKQNGGTLSNFLGQDLINLGRNFQFGIGSAYNALAGYKPPINPMPFKDQFPNNPYVKPLNPSVI